MFELNSHNIDKNKTNTVIKKSISLDENLHCFLYIDSSSINYSQALENNILDCIIDKISLNNTYWDFSVSLENINAFIKTWNQDKNEKQTANVFIGILENNNFIFSNIWKSSAYLVNKKDDLVTLTDPEENKDEFGYISNGTLSNKEFIIISTNNILQYLSQSDILDGIDNHRDNKHFSQNIADILENELLNENVALGTIQYINPNAIEEVEENKYLEFAKEKYFLLLDTKVVKNICKLALRGKNKLMQQSKMVKNIAFIAGISLCILFLYSTLSGIVNVATTNKQQEQNQELLTQARGLINLASNNVGNEALFEKNISDAEDLIAQIKQEGSYLLDIQKMQSDINILKKQFNKIETFDNFADNEVYSGNFESFVKLIQRDDKKYVIQQKGITGPINTGTTPKEYINTQLNADEYFIDATVIWSDIYLNTNKSKIVKFSKNGYFSFMDVKEQAQWNDSKIIKSYASNIYLVDNKKAQIYKHTLSGNSFSKAQEYLNLDDVNAIGEILSIAIDGGFYILRNDLVVQKFFASPEYEMAGISLNNLPKNYKIEDENAKVEIKTRSDLNYVYMLLNNKIFVFQPNSKNYRDVTALNYIGQIDGGTNQIKDFYINHDAELWIINDKGIYDLRFEISDDKLIIR